MCRDGEKWFWQLYFCFCIMSSLVLFKELNNGKCHRLSLIETNGIIHEKVCATKYIYIYVMHKPKIETPRILQQSFPLSYMWKTPA